MDKNQHFQNSQKYLLANKAKFLDNYQDVF